MSDSALALLLMGGTILLAGIVRLAFWLGRDRLGTVLVILLGAGVLNGCLNALSSRNVYGYGFPWKFWYDPYPVGTGTSRVPPLSPYVSWVFDRQALLFDVLLAVAVLAVALLVNEVCQRARGNRSSPWNPNP